MPARGYAWLAVAGAAWIATALGLPLRDVALHALGLGFIFSMMMGHAPVILPAVARVKLQFGGFFYVPLAALHASLAVRLLWGAADFAARAGATFNAAAIALFAATVVGAAVAWRIKHTRRARRTRPDACISSKNPRARRAPLRAVGAGVPALLPAREHLRRAVDPLWALQFSGLLGQPYLPGRCGTRTRCCSASRWR